MLLLASTLELMYTGIVYFIYLQEAAKQLGISTLRAHACCTDVAGMSPQNAVYQENECLLSVKLRDQTSLPGTTSLQDLVKHT